MLILLYTIVQNLPYFTLNHFSRAYGTGTSLSKYNRMRVCQSYESHAEASEAKRRKKSPCATYTETRPPPFDGDALKAEVASHPVDVPLNWSELGKKYKVLSSEGEIASNAGQVVKEYLRSAGVNIDRFNAYNGKGRRPNSMEKLSIRKAKIKIGPDASMPADATVTQMKNSIKTQVESGQLEIGTQVMPRTFTKLVLTDEGLEESSFTICGRKVPLLNIRQKLLEREEKFMKPPLDIYLLSCEEIQQMYISLTGKLEITEHEAMLSTIAELTNTRHLRFWHDASTVAGSGHFLVTVNTIYDPAIHQTSQQYKQRTGFEVDVPKKIEEPVIHLLAQASSSVEEQLEYGETRLDCVKELVIKCKSKSTGKEITDVIRFFSGEASIPKKIGRAHV